MPPLPATGSFSVVSSMGVSGQLLWSQDTKQTDAVCVKLGDVEVRRANRLLFASGSIHEAGVRITGKQQKDFLT